jgi:hypothetical protein
MYKDKWSKTKMSKIFFYQCGATVEAETAFPSEASEFRIFKLFLQ